MAGSKRSLGAAFAFVLACGFAAGLGAACSAAEADHAAPTRTSRAYQEALVAGLQPAASAVVASAPIGIRPAVTGAQMVTPPWTTSSPGLVGEKEAHDLVAHVSGTEPVVRLLRCRMGSSL